MITFFVTGVLLIVLSAAILCLLAVPVVLVYLIIELFRD